MSSSATELRDGALEANLTGAENLKGPPEPSEALETAEPSVNYNEGTVQSWTVRCAADERGKYKLDIEAFVGLAAVRKYDILPQQARSVPTSNASTEYSILLLQSQAPWPEIRDLCLPTCLKTDDAFSEPPLNKRPFRETKSSFAEVEGQDRYYSSRTWFRQSSVQPYRKDSSSIPVDEYGLPLDWVPAYSDMKNFSYWPKSFAEKSRGVRGYAKYQQVLCFGVPEMSVLYHRTPPPRLVAPDFIDFEGDPTAVFAPLLDRLRFRSDVTPSDLLRICMQELHRDILSDERIVLYKLNRSLGHIDRYMTDNDILRLTLKSWRQLMAQWRPYLHGLNTLEQSYLQTAWHARGDARVRRREISSWLGDEAANSELIDLVEELKLERMSILQHCESTFTMLMTTMSLIESEKAIKQAEEVTKLTQLAFFFIPLTFVAGIYGMNLGAFSPQGPSVWSWAVTSVGLSILTYSVLYYHSIFDVFRRQFSKVWERRRAAE